MLIFLMDWATLSFSLANIMLMGWLGLAVFFNAEKRSWGAWLASGSLLLGSLFFISHTSIFVMGIDYEVRGILFWFQMGLTSITALPFAWYVMILWYAGFWEDTNATLYRRQKYWFLISGILAISIFLKLLFSQSLDSYIGLLTQVIEPSSFFFNIPIFIIFYPTYIILCIGLALDALRKPGPSDRAMGTLARQRAWPWLVGTTLVFLLVSLMAGFIIIYTFLNTDIIASIFEKIILISAFDAVISGLIWLAVVLLGNAIVSYEIFTGKSLPRSGFLRQWQQVVLLATGYGITVSLAVLQNLRPIYSLIMIAMLMTAFLALLNQRSYNERKSYIENLRPFVTSEGLFEQLLKQESPEEINIQRPFEALARDVLNARVAYLIAWGPLAPLAGPPLCYPNNQEIEISGVAEIMSNAKSPEARSYEILPENYGGARWAVPLWSNRGQIGVILLGEKNDDGLYTQEEIEVAQTSGERLIDSKASAEISQRLMRLQRERLAESQILDQRARRVLHDEVLQQLHTAMIHLDTEKSEKTKQAIDLLGQAHNDISKLLHDMPTTSLPEINRLGIIGALEKLAEEEFRQAFKQVSWEITPEAREQIKNITPLASEVLYYAAREAIRNAAKHGQNKTNSLHLTLRIKMVKNKLHVEIEDDGIGVGIKHATQKTSSGQGLALHSTMMAVVGGELTMESEAEKFTKVTLKLPQFSTHK